MVEQILEQENDAYDDCDSVFDFGSRTMMPFSVDVDHSARTEDSGPGYYRWTKKGWTWTPGDDAVEVVDEARMDAREWVKESTLPEDEKSAILDII